MERFLEIGFGLNTTFESFLVWRLLGEILILGIFTFFKLLISAFLLVSNWALIFSIFLRIFEGEGSPEGHLSFLINLKAELFLIIFKFFISLLNSFSLESFLD